MGRHSNQSDPSRRKRTRTGRGGGRGRGRNRSKSIVRKAKSGTQVKHELPDQVLSTSAGSGRGRSRSRGQGRGRSQNRSGRDRILQPISISKNSIHSEWKQQIGGLIRYYVNERIHSRNESISQQEAEQEVERMYYRSDCSIEGTKALLLEALGVTNDMQNEWVKINMVLDEQDLGNINLKSYDRATDNKGIILSQIDRPGEGPAHSHETWTNVIVPNWAVGKVFTFKSRIIRPSICLVKLLLMIIL